LPEEEVDLTQEVRYHKGALVGNKVYAERVRRASSLMAKAELDAVLLTKPQNMLYLAGDGRLCAFTIVSKTGATYVGVPKTVYPQACLTTTRHL